MGNIKGITMTKDERGAVFDVADQDVKVFEDFIAVGSGAKSDA